MSASKTSTERPAEVSCSITRVPGIYSDGDRNVLQVLTDWRQKLAWIIRWCLPNSSIRNFISTPDVKVRERASLVILFPSFDSLTDQTSSDRCAAAYASI